MEVQVIWEHNLSEIWYRGPTGDSGIFSKNSNNLLKSRNTKARLVLAHILGKLGVGAAR